MRVDVAISPGLTEIDEGDSDAIHSPNEHFGVSNFYNGIETISNFYNFYSNKI